MIVGLCCQCGSVVPRLRRIFNKAGMDNWLEVPIYEGRKGLEKFNDELPEEYKNSLGYGILQTFLSSHNTYALVIAIDIEHKDIRFANAFGNIQDQLDAEILAGQFAND